MKTTLLGEFSAIEAMKQRSSCRTYQEAELTKNEEKQLSNFIQDVSSEDFRFVLATAKYGEKFGTYGVIKGAKNYLICIANKNFFEQTPEYVGYAFERVVLYATALHLGTCWMSGTFKRSQFEKAIELQSDETIPYVSPVGYSSQEKRFLETMIRKAVGSAKRKPAEQLFFQNDVTTPLDLKTETYQQPLELLRIAPSASNAQPWRIIKQDKRFHFYHIGKSSTLITRSDIGIAMSHFEMACQELALSGKFQKCEAPTFKELQYVTTWQI